MKNQKTNNRSLISKITARVMLVVLLLAGVLNLFGCYFGPTVAYNWCVNTHDEFVVEIEKYNSVNDGFVNTFISFDFDDNKDISEKYYQMCTTVNKGAVYKYGLCDKYSDGPIYIELVYYFKSNIENDQYSEHAYKIYCVYGDVEYSFSEYDKIEIQNTMTHNCVSLYKDRYYGDRTSENMIYNNVYHYEFLVNGVEFACIHISSIKEASEEKLEEIVQMLMDSMVIINTEE